VIPALLLGHAGLSLVLIIGGLIPRANRVMLIRVCAGLGIVLGAALAVSSGRAEVWRTTVLDTEHAVLAGLTIACAWLLVGALDRNQGRWDVAALIGVGCTGIAMMGTSRWLVPGLLFSFIASLAVAAAVSSFHHRGEVWLQIFATAAAIVGAIVIDWQDTEVWAAPDGIRGWSFWLLLAGVAVRAGAIPALGMWRLCGCSAAAGAPLLVGSSFIILAGPGARVEPWLAVGFLGLSVLVVVVALVLKREGDVAGSWPVLLTLAVVFASPGAVFGAGIAAVLAVSAAGLGLHDRYAGDPARALVVGLAPLTIGFAVLAAGATVAFERATEALTDAESVPWTVAAAAFPVALAAGLILASRLARGAGAARSRAGVTAITTLVLFLAAAVFWLFPDDLGQLASDPLGPERSVLILHLVALVGGVGAGFLTYKKGYATKHLPRTSYEAVKEHSVIPTLPARLTAALALIFAFAVAGAVGWLTIEGLQVGFL
jgi:hypothetical protein